MSDQQQKMVAGTVATVCALGTVAVVLLLIVQRKRHRRCGGDGDNGTAFVRAGQVEQLYIYPIKSCKGNKRDRHFLVVDSMRHNQMLTGRIYPRMLLIRAHVEHDVLCVQFPDRNPVQVRLKEVQQHNHVRRARLFSDLQTDGLDCGDEVAKALDEFLLAKEGTAGDSRKLRLIYFGGDWLYTERDAKPEQRWWANNAVPEVKDKVAYADLAGYMAFSSASEIRVDARNFRPNLVISGLPPFDEDRWLYVRAGDAEFACYKPCTRCVMTTIDPDSGCRNAKMEPLKELRKYRLAPGKLYEVFKESPVFGVNMAIIKPGRVRIGDPVWIRYKPSPF
uniref:MOSC domain-containing protein n=1 Tax=Globodera rostochiensis TaxID=31243 RepID=A0A914GY32_GLORO